MAYLARSAGEGDGMRTARSPKNWGISLENLQDLAEVRIIELRGIGKHAKFLSVSDGESIKSRKL